MKIKMSKKSYDEVMKIEKPKHKKPTKPGVAARMLLNSLSASDLKATHFSYEAIGMEKLGKHEPCLILMNHSSFIDLKIAESVFKDRPLNIICTSDGFVGKEGLMRWIGCVPTYKFVSDIQLVRDMSYCVKELKSSILMYPEASYSFDGTATPLPESLGKCIKMLGVPVVTVITHGAFLRDPLYNNLQLRDTEVSAEVEYFLSADEVKEKSTKEINKLLYEKFSFDNFKWQYDHNILIREDFRADHLNRVLYKCPHCLAEGTTEGKGTLLTCHNCNKVYELEENGRMKATDGEAEYPHIPDWYSWERACVRRELEEGTYRLEVPVTIRMLVDTDCLYEVGEGVLTHTAEGFHLTGCDGKLEYRQKPTASYSLYSDYYWYELGDMICVGDTKALYYCFPKVGGDVVAKTRLATEELYKIKKVEK